MLKTMEHTPKNPRVVQLEMALLNVTSAFGDLIAAIRAGKAPTQQTDQSLVSGNGTYLEIAAKKHEEAMKILHDVSAPT